MNKREQVADVERWEQATDWFLRLRAEGASEADLLGFERWTNADERNSVAYQHVVGSWDAVGQLSAAPGIVAGRHEALADSQRAMLERALGTPASRRPRWAVAASVAVVVGLCTLWALSPSASIYSTDRGEERTVRLWDGSMVFLDADSRVRIRYRRHEREIYLERGQARFSVAKDPLRPFRVHARDNTVVALGTQFDVDLAPHALRITLLEGHVAITGVPVGPSPTAAGRPGPVAAHVVELTPGEALKVCDNGDSQLTSHVDVSRVTAWQTGKVFFDNEPLWSAVDRIGRYAKQHLDVDPSVAHVTVSGVFKTSDPAAFVEAITHYFPIDAVQISSSRIILTQRKTETPQGAE